MTSISSFSLSSTLLQSILTAQTSLAQTELEVSTGTYADVGLTLGAQTGQDVSLHAQQSLLETFATTNNLISTNLTATQSAMSNLQTTAEDFLNDLIDSAGGNGNESGSADSLQATAQSALESLISGLNTNVDGNYIFAGINTATAPITDYYGANAPNQQAVNAAFLTTFGFSQSSSQVSSITSSQMQSFIDNDFAPLFQGANWTADWSSASDTATTAEISPSQTVATSVSANQAAFQDLAQAYTMVAELGTQNLSSDALQTVIDNAESLVQTGLSALTDIQSNVGVTQSDITAATNQISVQMNVLSTQIGNLEDINTYQASTQVTDLQTQIETAYELTSQLSQLSLVKFL